MPKQNFHKTALILVLQKPHSIQFYHRFNVYVSMTTAPPKAMDVIKQDIAAENSLCENIIIIHINQFFILKNNLDCICVI